MRKIAITITLPTKPNDSPTTEKIKSVCCSETIRDELTGIDNEIKAKIGNASTAVCGGYKISFKEQTTSGIDRKRIAEDFPALDFKNYATRTRVLRVSSPKGKSA